MRRVIVVAVNEKQASTTVIKLEMLWLTSNNRELTDQFVECGYQPR